MNISEMLKLFENTVESRQFLLHRLLKTFGLCLNWKRSQRYSEEFQTITKPPRILTVSSNHLQESWRISIQRKEFHNKKKAPWSWVRGEGREGEEKIVRIRTEWIKTWCWMQRSPRLSVPFGWQRRSGWCIYIRTLAGRRKTTFRTTAMN